MAMHRDATACLLTQGESSPVSTTDKLALAPRHIRFTKHPADTRAECLPGRDMFRDMLEWEYAIDPRVLERIADGKAQTTAFLIERFVIENKLTIFTFLQLFSIMRIDPSMALPAASASTDEAYVIDLYALPRESLKHAFRRISGADDRRRAVAANPDVFKNVDDILMPPIEISPNPTQHSSDVEGEEGGEEDEEEEEEWQEGASLRMLRGKRPVSSAPRRPLQASAKRFHSYSQSEVVSRSQVAGLPYDWIREDRISPGAQKLHFVVISPNGTVYPSLVKARSAAACPHPGLVEAEEDDIFSAGLVLASIGMQ